MSIHKLTAGLGYDYLTLQVAALDATERGHLGLASYYTERGETPGVWMGSGMAGIDGLNPGDVVTAEQMRVLFGAGLHPLAEQRQRQLQGPDLTVRDYQSVTRLGAPFKIYQQDVSPFRVEVAKRITAFNQTAGLPGPIALTDDVFSAWQTDRSSGMDAIMLAPTRELVSQLNQRARAHRLATQPDRNERDAWRLAMLADGNPASVGEQVITRTNNRTLHLTASDWVKNGDRWTLLKVNRGGDLTVQHHRNGRIVRLPGSYVAESVELGYATTVHTAQGVTADTMHGLVTGKESRQQLYTMLT
jgi:hypothetical protein